MSTEEPTPQSGAVVIYGASDDLIEIEGQVPGCDEYGAEDDGAQFVLIGDNAQTRLRITYMPGGVWGITVSQIDEDMAMLPMFINSEGYSAKATVQGVRSIVREAL